MVEQRGLENLGEMLFREGLITHAQLEESLKRQNETKKSLGQILVEIGAITESVKMSFLRKKMGYDFISLENKKVDPLYFTYIPKSFAQKYHLVPVKLENRTLVIAMDDPSDLTVMDNLKTIVGMPIKPVIASSADIDEILRQYPYEEEEAAAVETELSSLAKLLRKLVFIFFAFIFPIIVIVIVYKNSEVFREFLRPTLKELKGFSFDVFIYTLLGGSLWIIIVYEINALIFERGGKTIQPPSPSEEEFKE
ncbi:MAG: hypothetical protein NT106_00955 [Candidatus Sumerlaeota bacterium]|nr:hypothetical protein [Candidatus Sumerlaeota bacterium]